MIAPQKTSWMAPAIGAHERGAPVVCPEPAERPGIPSIGHSPSLVITLEADAPRAKTSPADFIPDIDRS
jgi:hypothetical protein